LPPEPAAASCRPAPRCGCEADNQQCCAGADGRCLARPAEAFIATRTDRIQLKSGAAQGASPRGGDRFIFAPTRIGPRFEWLDRDLIRVLDGGLAGREFRARTELLRNTAAISLLEGNVEVASEQVERDPPGRGVILWDAGVREHLRGNGLCAIMTWILFRELLADQATASFRIRMVRALRAGWNDAELQNVGMGVVAVRFGFRPDPAVEPKLSARRVTGMQAIPAGRGHPPALRVNLDVDPLVIVAFALTPDTLRPVQDSRLYLQLEGDLDTVRSYARRGLLAVSGNYCLRRPDVDHFVNRLAVSEDEAIRFRHMLRGF
jgi:hypothetical protein